MSNPLMAQGASRVRLRDRFFDRAGRPISLDEWTVRRLDPDYCRIGYWEGEGGAWIYTFWMGLDLSFGVGAEAAIFHTHVSAFGNQPNLEWAYPTDTEWRALALHDRVVSFVEAGITPPSWELGDILTKPTQSMPVVEEQRGRP
ncbi:hypothetical protein [Mycobacterium sp. 1245852.3]|uniref:hypothetical protein n=1 Tax=Mycobacterium sp. 1245852.3 TaxID=1856860 RepID=UPI0012EA00F9|nr:hypothetical protein [Mycobacterium sp. 1245852.3]